MTLYIFMFGVERILTYRLIDSIDYVGGQKVASKIRGVVKWFSLKKTR
ncbi:MAG: hypothetical protein Nk1A_4090 [Endomicrobiia bacterium]|nr:MAG: hypothetical protein Nk1A_4090 [Endomicrobiia bacterium]